MYKNHRKSIIQECSKPINMINMINICSIPPQKHVDMHVPPRIRYLDNFIFKNCLKIKKHTLFVKIICPVTNNP